MKQNRNENKLTSQKQESQDLSHCKIFKAVFPGKYIQADDAISQLPALIKQLGSKGLILASSTAKSKILPNYNSIEECGSITIEKFHGSNISSPFQKHCKNTNRTACLNTYCLYTDVYFWNNFKHYESGRNSTCSRSNS